MDKKDILCYFFTLIKNNKYDKDIYKLLNDKYYISVLEINRIIRLLNNLLEYPQ